jgi:hypothetical protein
MNEGRMHNRLAALMSFARIGIGRMLGNRRLEQIGMAELAQAQARRTSDSAIRPGSNRFRVGVGQMTHHEHLAAQVEVARLREQADRDA